MGKRNNRFNLKDALITLGIYFVLIQFIIPIFVTRTYVIKDPNLAMQDLDLFMSNYGAQIQFYSFFMGVILLLILYYPHLKKALIAYHQNFLKNTFRIMKYYFMGQGLNILVSALLMVVFDITTSSENQIAVEGMLNAAPVMMAIVTIVFAPIIEEIVFRGGLYLGIRDKIGNFKAMLFSSFLFGAIHIIPQFKTSNPKELLLILPYSILGYYMVKSVKETDSLMGGIYFHFINNLIATLVVFYAV